MPLQSGMKRRKGLEGLTRRCGENDDNILTESSTRRYLMRLNVKISCEGAQHLSKKRQPGERRT